MKSAHALGPEEQGGDLDVLETLMSVGKASVAAAGQAVRWDWGVGAGVSALRVL